MPRSKKSTLKRKLAGKRTTPVKTAKAQSVKKSTSPGTSAFTRSPFNTIRNKKARHAALV
jgi:hypothetical protein